MICQIKIVSIPGITIRRQEANVSITVRNKYCDKLYWQIFHFIYYEIVSLLFSGASKTACVLFKDRQTLPNNSLYLDLMSFSPRNGKYPTLPSFSFTSTGQSKKV